MRTPLHFVDLLAAFAWVCFALAAPAATADDGRPIVVELFTSQSCSSCPPAEAYLGELAGREGIIALEFHVDYWDNLVHGADGRWKDVFSSPAHTARQRTYNHSIRGTNNVYTPQMVIGGRTEAVKSRRGNVEAAIEEIRSLDQTGPVIGITATPEDDLRVHIEGGGPNGDAGVWLIRFRQVQTTQVSAGENNGRSLTNHHAVTGIERIGSWKGGSQVFDLSGQAPGAGEGCAVIIQDDKQGPIDAAAACPKS